MDHFNLLTHGIKFDTKKFERDTKKFNLYKRKPNDDDDNNDDNVDNVPINSSPIKKTKKGNKKSIIYADNIRSNHNIIVNGSDIQCPIETFDELDLPDYLKNNLKKSNYLKPTPIQMQVIPLMNDQRELICSAPTGSGKTLSFLLPIITQLKESKNVGFRAVILSPTRELAKQIHRECIWIADGSSLRIHLIKNVNLAKKKFGTNTLKYDILVTTPKRLQFLLEQNPPAINIQNIEWLIADECDRLFEPSFRDQFSLIFRVCFQSSKLKRAMFSATFDPNLEKWCQLNLNNVVTVVVGGRNQVINSIEQKLMFVGSEAGKLIALKEIIANGCKTPVLIFVNKISKANFLERELNSLNLKAETIHADRSQEYRDKIVREFREGKILFLICTELMGRGMDFKAVNLVINYDLPSSAFNYIHHIGRTGRAGRSGTAITFYTLNDEGHMSSIVNIIKQSGSEVPQHLQGMDRKKVAEIKKLMQKKVKRNRTIRNKTK